MGEVPPTLLSLAPLLVSLVLSMGDGRNVDPNLFWFQEGETREEAPF